MQLTVEYEPIADIFRSAAAEGRRTLFEYEVYTMLALSGAETPPKYLFLPRNAKLVDEEVMSLPGDMAVIKIVSPTIVHKTEVGGVRIVPKTPDNVRSAVRRMLSEAPQRYADLLERDPASTPEVYAGLRGEDLTAAIAADIRGVLQVQFMPPDSNSFGNELIVGLRRTRAFGMVISAGLGGTDAELYAQRFRKGQAIVASLCAQTSGKDFFKLFRHTVSYSKLAGLTRGQRRIVTDEQLVECFESFIRMGNHFSPCNPDAPFVIEELEVNPFAFTDYLMVPLDGMCRFSLPEEAPARRPTARIDHLLHPKSIGIIGVSTKRRNFGRIILDNIIHAGFDKERITIVRDGEPDPSGVRCLPSLADVAAPLDLFIVAVGADQVPALAEEVISLGAAHSVMLIPGGLGETADSREAASRLTHRIAEVHREGDGGPVFLGANCMGVISRPGHYDTWFIPREKFHASNAGHANRTAIVSQSGAFLLNRFSQAPQMNPAYLISMGNQTDLTVGDMMRYFTDFDVADVVAVYVEGFGELDGLAFTQAVRETVAKGKQVIFYKAGRTPEGQNATSGHTASLAGDYMVCENAVRQAGAMVARSFTEFQELVTLANMLKETVVRGKRLGAVSGAGFEAVGMADSIHSDEFNMHLGTLSPATVTALREVVAAHGLDRLVTVANPLDINPGANDAVHARVAEIVLADDGIDALVISLDPLSPMTHSLDDGSQPAYNMREPGTLIDLMATVRQQTNKPLVVVVDGGTAFEPFRQALLERGIPVFPVCDRAIATLSIYMEARLAK